MDASFGTTWIREVRGLNVWPFRQQKIVPSAVATESYLTTTADYKADPYYSLANSLAWALNKDPSDVDNLADFVEGCALGVTLTEDELSKALGDASNSMKVFSDPQTNENYHILKMRVRKLIRELGIANQQSRIALLNEQRQALESEIQTVEEQLTRGLPINYDSDLLSARQVQEIQQKFYAGKVDEERESIRSQLDAKKDVIFDASLISIGEVDELRERHFAARKKEELSNLRSQLERGNPLEFDSAYISEGDIALVVADANSARSVWLRSRVRPAAQPYGVSHIGAEHLVGDWLKYLGIPGVEVTQASQDGGVDVLTDEFACQVKYYKNQNVSVQEVREIFGVATAMGRMALVFTSSAMTPSAIDFAEQVGIPVVKFVVEVADLFALNGSGKTFLESRDYE